MSTSPQPSQPRSLPESLPAWVEIADISCSIDCGTTHFHDDEVRKVLKARDGVTGEMKDSVDNMSFGGGVNSVHVALKRDVDFLKETPLVRAELKPNVAGFVYDIETGELKGC